MIKAKSDFVFRFSLYCNWCIGYSMFILYLSYIYYML